VLSNAIVGGGLQSETMKLRSRLLGVGAHRGTLVPKVRLMYPFYITLLRLGLQPWSGLRL
jgi:hypothetical protein